MANNYKNPAEIFKPFVRDGSFPIDISERYFSYNEALEYTETDPSAYPGQIISVVNGKNVAAYQITYGPSGKLTLTQLMTPSSGVNYIIYKGTLGSEDDGADFQDLIYDEIGQFEIGWVFKVVTAGTYCGLVLEVGDEVTSTKAWDTEYDLEDTGKASYWSVVQADLLHALQYDPNERRPSPLGIPMFTESGYNAYIVQNSGLQISYDYVSLFGLTISSDDRSKLINITGSAAQTDWSLITLYDEDSPLADEKLYFNGGYNTTYFDREDPNYGNTLLDLRASSLNVLSNRRIQLSTESSIITDLPEEWLEGENDTLESAKTTAKVPSISALAEAVAGRPREYKLSVISKGNYNKIFYNAVLPSNSYITEVKVFPKANFPYSAVFSLYAYAEGENNVELVNNSDVDMSDSTNYYVIRPETFIDKDKYIMVDIKNSETTEEDSDLPVDILVKYDIPVIR